ncbi:MAG: gliding motility-associated C-terminal domain-containing protein, partial [Bacteroidetes bacterium]|nr:gliding motility-associated C-terminal domain-containing protein [Bacteroidota bacterium]
MKKISFFLVALCTIFCYTLIAQVPTSSLVGEWTFSGNANDNSVSANHGTVMGASLTADRCGNPNSAYSFNGSSNYILMAVPGPTGTASRSVSFWARSTNTVVNSPRSCFDYGSSNINGGSAFEIVWNYCAQGVGIDVSTQALIRGNACLNSGVWNHIVLVYDQSLGGQISTIKFYINGVLQTNIVCNVSGTTALVNTANLSPIVIGAAAGGFNSRYFAGDLDDFYLYSRALTQQEVLQLYNESPCTPTLSGLSSICQGTTSTIYSVTPIAGATSYTWSLPNGWTGTSTTNTISVVTGSASGVVSVSGLGSNGCFASNGSATMYVTFNPAPSQSLSISGNFTVCSGQTTTLTASGATTYSWNTGATSNSIAITPTVNTYYSVTGTSTSVCIAGSSSVLVNVYQATFTFFPYGNTFSITCSNPVIQIFTSNAALNYTWSSITSFPLTGTVNTFDQTNLGTWTVTGVNPTSGCTETHTLNIVENTTPPVVASLTPSLQIIDCSNPVVQTITATAQSPTLNITHSFFSPYPASNVNMSSNPAIYGGGIGTYTYILTNNENGCSSTPITFSILTSPGTPTFQVSSTGTLSNHGGFTVGCSNHSLTVLNIVNANSTPVPGGALSYSFFAPGGNLYSTNQFTVVSIPGTWTVSVLSIQNSCYLTMPVTVVQNTISPNISAIVPTQILTCFTPSVTLMAQTTNSAATFEWKFQPQQNLQGASITINTITPSNNTSAGIFTLVITDQDNGCTSSSVIPMQQNLFTPTPKISVTQTLITCITPTMQLSNSSITGILNSTGFINNKPIVATLWQGPSPQPTAELVSSYVATVPGTYSMTVRDENNGCYSFTTITMGDFRIYPIITPSPGILDCGENFANVSARVSPEEQTYAYVWDSGNKLVVAGTNTTATLKAMEVGTYTITAINNSNGCASTDSVRVISGILTGTFSADKTGGCAPTTITFNNQSTSSINNQSITSVWSFGNGTSQTQTVISEPIKTEYQRSGTYQIILFTAKGSCQDSDTLTINVDIAASLEIPNVFTPNGDGVNDVFFLKTSNLSEITAIIFDRWGHKVYELTSQTGNIAWDGKNLQGQDSAAGTYFYIISAKSDNCGNESFE